MTIDGVTYRMKTTPAAASVKIGASDSRFARKHRWRPSTAARARGRLLCRDPGWPLTSSAASRPRPLIVTANRFGTVGQSIGVSYTATGSSAGTWASTPPSSGGADPADNTDVIAYYLTVSTGGASGTAQITITSDTTGEAARRRPSPRARPSASERRASTLTPTWTGDLVEARRGRCGSCRRASASIRSRTISSPSPFPAQRRRPA